MQVCVLYVSDQKMTMKTGTSATRRAINQQKELAHLGKGLFARNF
ncbi:hypothetical protein RO3G_07392 [Rhizopus delemar RA 99-880]|uniref:Uncharacterized protein n=1 Tax=Rhizopus delemar (strain RA 99-880 / ATCC MYA-4621 / FGSC 9543 / NRRL 43880) TaxID=246409 RepID=I1C2K7_RHIO9|nr:hypothetical protein RO3G_07392 [Rhizopus delemar RA 99-880]|eukprot:EIE82687.1 hypothetical protein RO3G_07392 [Rhizopus delemar RA 99-880]